MDARTGLVIGGMTAVAASVAVVTAVALANTAALADAPGTTVAAGGVVVPVAGSPTPSATASLSPAPQAPVATPEPEVVEGPAPVVARTPAPTQKAPAATPATEVAPPPPATPPAELDAAIAAAKATGDWDSLRRWAIEQGWSTGRIEALVSRLEAESADRGRDEQRDERQSTSDRQGLVGGSSWEPEQDLNRQTQSTQDLIAPELSVPKLDPPKLNPPTPDAPKPKVQTRSSDQPANAGSDAGHGNGADPGTKKDQSRDSPDRRD